jgi:hypothetical protein
MRAAQLVRGRAAGWWFLLAAVLAVVAANAVLARGSTSRGGAASGPSVAQARSVASKEFGLLAGGGWVQAWGLWSAAGRSALSQADFVRLNTECRPALGEPYVIGSITAIDATTVRVDWHQGSTAGSDTLVVEGGAWRFQPDAQTLAELRGRKAAGKCH